MDILIKVLQIQIKYINSYEQIQPQICPTKEIGYIGYIFAFYATKMGYRASGDTKVQDPPWSFNGPCHGPTIGRVENRKSWKIIKPQVDPIDAHKNKTICMI